MGTGSAKILAENIFGESQPWVIQSKNEPKMNITLGPKKSHPN